MKPKLKLIILFSVLIIVLAIILYKHSYTQTDEVISSAPVAEYMDAEMPNEIGEFKIGDDAPFKPGYELGHPYKRIPPSNFYVYLWGPNIEYTCVYEECGKNGEVVASLRGWLQGMGTLYEELVPLVNSSKVKSLVLVADKDSKIVGVYPNKDMPDLLDILSEHEDLADFKMLEGINELGDLKLGSALPFNPAEYVDEHFKEEIKEPKFYLAVVHETTREFLGCPYYECGGFLETIFAKEGWFTDFDHNNSDIVDKLGLNSSQVARGELTLVLLADENKKIVAIHPNKDMRDIYTVMAQHPELIQFMNFPYR